MSDRMKVIAARHAQNRLTPSDIDFIISECERLSADRDEWQLEAQGCVCGAHRVADCNCLDPA